MPSTTSTDCCTACLAAEALIHASGAGKALRRRRSSTVMADVSVLIYGALSNLLTEFDYSANKDSNTAKAARMLALAATRLARVDARSARVRGAVLSTLRD